MLRAADVLADLVKVAQNGGEYDETHANELLAELTALQSGGPAAEAVNPLAGDEAPNPFEALGFTPVALAIEDEAVAAPPPAPSFEYTIEFRPKPDLYYKGNETSRLTRELARLGEIEVRCHTGEIPTLSDLDPEAVYLSWTIKLKTSEDEAAVRSVFEFVEGDCDLSIAATSLAPQPADPASPAPDAAPVQPNSPQVDERVRMRSLSPFARPNKGPRAKPPRKSTRLRAPRTKRPPAGIRSRARSASISNASTGSLTWLANSSSIRQCSPSARLKPALARWRASRRGSTTSNT